MQRWAYASRDWPLVLRALSCPLHMLHATSSTFAGTSPLTITISSTSTLAITYASAITISAAAPTITTTGTVTAFVPTSTPFTSRASSMRREPMHFHRQRLLRTGRAGAYLQRGFHSSQPEWLVRRPRGRKIHVLPATIVRRGGMYFTG